MKRVLVTGGAGFIGSHLTEALVAEGHDVTVLDDLRSGDGANLADVRDDIAFIEGDVADATVLDDVVRGKDVVWHLAADPDVRGGADDPVGQFEANVQSTQRLLEAMRWHGVPALRFTSTSTIYGNATVRPTPEDYGPLLPISIYGASKLACEGLAAAYADLHGMAACFFRFANVVGPRARHGIVVDFVRKLQEDPARLEILGDGTQTKSYVHVADTVAAMLQVDRDGPAGVHPYNIGTEDAVSVRDIADAVSQVVTGAQPEFHFTGGTAGGAGWSGDVKFMGLAIDKLRGLGWRPEMGSLEAVRHAAQALVDADAP